MALRRSIASGWSGRAARGSESWKRPLCRTRCGKAKPALCGCWKTSPTASSTRCSACQTSSPIPVQGVCADVGLVAIALIEEPLIDASISGECGLVGWIHDEFLVEVEEHDVAVAKRILEESMVEAFLWAFPDAPTRGLVDARAGRTWAETKKKVPMKELATA
jgi:hypothetical protein